LNVTAKPPLIAVAENAVKDIAVAIKPRRAIAGDDEQHATVGIEVPVEVRGGRDLALEPLPAFFGRVKRPQVAQVGIVEAAADQNRSGLRIVHGEMPRARRRPGNLRFTPYACLQIENPRVGQIMTLPIAAEQHEHLISSIGDKATIHARRRLDFRRMTPPGLLCEGVNPGIGVANDPAIAASLGHVSAAE
jgi:hypothetical protein